MVNAASQPIKALEGKVTTDEFRSYNSFIENLPLNVKGLDEERLANILEGNLADVRLASLAAVPGVAIALMDAEAETRIEENQITGVVSLYGGPSETKQFKQQELDSILAALNSGVPIFGESLANLHVRNNTIYRLSVSEVTLISLRAVKPGAVRSLTRLYRRCFITNNAFKGGDNWFVMEHLALTSNSFEKEPNADAGVVAAQAASYVGNFSPSDIRLFNLAPRRDKAVNLGINLVNA